MSTKPLELKSPDNAMALGSYLLTAVLGGSFIAAGATSAGLTLLLGPSVPLWGMVMLLSGLAGLSAALTCPRSVNPVAWLKVERVAAVLVCGSWAVYSVASQMTPNHTNVGLILFGLQAVQAVWRAGQITVELHALKLAVVKPISTVTVESLADPRDSA